jgi:hypothetical protein
MYVDVRTTISVDDMSESEIQRELSVRIVKYLRATEAYKPRELKRLRTLCKRRKVTATAVLIAAGRDKAPIILDAMPDLFGGGQHAELMELLGGFAFDRKA